MNAKITQIKQSYNVDLSDVNHLASECFNWVSTLIHQATKEMDNRPSQAKTLLNIAEYLADYYSEEFYQEATKADKALAETKGL